MNQSHFTRALLDAGSPMPGGLVDPQGRPAEGRFSVYRNTVAVSLTRALEEGFPAVRILLGEEFFAALARAFLRDHPPRSPLLMLYGDAFPAYLEAFPSLARWPYLADVARLEHALRDSYHAADGVALPAEKLRLLGLSGLLTRRLRLAPSVRLIPTRWPIVSIWRATLQGGPQPVLSAPALGENALILRPHFDPEPHPLSPQGADAVAALLAGRPLGEALSALGEAEAAQLLSLLLSHHAITEALQ